MGKKLFILLLSLFFFQCNHNHNQEIRKEVLNYFVDSLIDTQFVDYDLCGTFDNEFTDSVLRLNLSAIDTFISFDEDKKMIAQYNYYKGKELKTLLYNLNKYKTVVLTDSDSITDHFIISAPLLTHDMDKAVIFFTGFNSQKRFVEQYIYIFLNLNLNVSNWDIWALKLPYRPEYYSDPYVYSLIPKKEQK